MSQTKRKKKRIGSVEAEKAACIRAFKRYPKARYAWCLHHGQIAERIFLNSDFVGWPDWMGRVKYILAAKPRGEQARRFRNFRPVKSAGTRQAHFTRDRLDQEWPHNTWDGSSIFR